MPNDVVQSTIAASDGETPKVVGDTGTSAKSPAKRVRRHTGFDTKPGRRAMKEYVVTKSELYELGGVGLFATLFFSVASAFGGFAVDASRDLAFNATAAKEALAFWGAMRTAATIVTIVFFVFGVLLIVYGGFRLNGILEETTHEAR